MPTMPVVDPAIAASSATSGTLRYSASSPVAAVTESPKHDLQCEEKCHRQHQGVHDGHGVAHQPDKQSLGEHPGV